VNECGEPLVEPTSETDYHSQVVGLESRVGLDTADNPNTVGQAPEHKPFLVFYKMFIT
jgi:hypothetical protein